MQENFYAVTLGLIIGGINESQTGWVLKTDGQDVAGKGVNKEEAEICGFIIHPASLVPGLGITPYRWSPSDICIQRYPDSHLSRLISHNNCRREASTLLQHLTPHCDQPLNFTALH